jgi:hypothetical protein
MTPAGAAVLSLLDSWLHGCRMTHDQTTYDLDGDESPDALGPPGEIEARLRATCPFHRIVIFTGVPDHSGR